MKRREFLSSLGAAGLAAGVPAALLATPATAFQPTPSDLDEKVFAEARKQFLIPPGVAYCNTGTLGASPVEVLTAMADGHRKLERELAAWPYETENGAPLTGYQELKEVRALAGTLLNAPAEEIALTLNATMGMSMLASGLDLAAGDEVVTTNHEHPGGISPWRVRAKRHGVVVTEVQLDPLLDKGPDAIVGAFAAAITRKTRVVMFSHITSGLGILMPARELCALAHHHGALAFVDGAQSVGQIAVDVKALDADAYVTSPHKWLLAPKGTGILYVKREVQPKIWTTLASSHWDDHANGAFRFMQYGTGSIPAVDGFVAALNFVKRIGVDRIARWDRMLWLRLRDGLETIPRARISSPRDRRLASALTTFRVEGMKAKALQDALWTRNVRVRAQNDSRGVRLSTHVYVMPSDIDVILDVVRRA